MYEVGISQGRKLFIPGCLKRYVFHQAIQVTNEPSIDFFTRLCKLASTCELADKNIEIRDQFIDKCSSNRLRRRLLEEPNLTLETQSNSDLYLPRIHDAAALMT